MDFGYMVEPYGYRMVNCGKTVWLTMVDHMVEPYQKNHGSTMVLFLEGWLVGLIFPFNFFGVSGHPRRQQWLRHYLARRRVSLVVSRRRLIASFIVIGC